MNDRPRYVEYGALATVPGPLRCEGATLDCFVLRADRAKLEALLERVFTVPTDGSVKVRPLFGLVMATFGVIDAITPTTPPFDQMGTAREPQVALWVPVAIVRSTSDGDVAERFFVFVPFIWLDNPISLASGREVYGWSKSWGTPALPSPGGEQVWSLDGFGLDYGKHEQPSMRRLLTITQGAARAGAPEGGGTFDAPADLARHLHRTFAGDAEETRLRWGLRFGAELLADMLHKRLPELYLKQVRAIDDGTSAALQQVVAADMTVGRWSASLLWHEHQLAVTQVDSEPIADELGLADQAVPLAFRVEMDFLVPRGEVLWQAP
jgi:hypothetical protein